MFGLKLLARNFSKVPVFVKNARVLKHFEEVHRYETGREVQNLRKIVANELQKPNASFTSLDIRLCSNLKKITTDEFLSLLNSWGTVRPDILPTTVFYQTFLKLVRNGLWKDSKWNHLVQIIHFVGYLNDHNDSKTLMILFLRSVNNSLSLPLAHYKDVCIICEASFRTSTCISSPAIRNKIENILENLTDEISKNSIWLVMLIKIMIFSKYFDYYLLNKLADKWILSENLKKIAFTTQCYILALFSNASIRHEQLMMTLVSSIAGKMERNSLFRIKDVSMFLWSVSSLDYKLDQMFLKKTVHPYLMTELNERNLKDGLSIMIQCCLSLWMISSIPKQLLNEIITMASFQILIDKNKNFRDLSRFALLMGILEAENLDGLTSEQRKVKEALKNTSLLVPSLAKETEKRPELAQLCDIVCEAGGKQARLEYPVTIYLSGVSGIFEQHHFHLDLLDKTVCLASSVKPAGRIQAKVKLLKLHHPGMKHAFVTIDDLPKLRNKPFVKRLLQLPYQ